MSDAPESEGSAPESVYQPPVEGKEVTSTRRPLRIWPAVLCVSLVLILKITPDNLVDNPLFMMVRLMGPLLLCLLLGVWWVFFSRAEWSERIIGLFGLALVGGVTTYLQDKSLFGFGSLIFAVPYGIAAFAAGAVLVPDSPRRLLYAVLASVVGFGVWDLVRLDGVWGDMGATLSYRWSPTKEDAYLETLAQRKEASAPEVDESSLDDLAWTDFRGPRRDGSLPGVVLEEDWQQHPPVEKWKHPIGPGWSSFSVAGELLFTQEQRGDSEAVVAYHADAGNEVWSYEYPSRFWEAVGGAGPRATPTLHAGNIYAMGAEGFLMRLDALSGELVWQKDIRKDSDRDPPTWGFSSSPLVWQDLVIVHAGGKKKRGVLAYELETGKLRWGGEAGNHSYSSPQLYQSGEQTCLLILTNAGLSFIDPSTGERLGFHDWEYGGYRVVQPTVLEDSGILLGTAMGTGTRKITVSCQENQFTTEEIWTSKRMNPYYNDYVAHQGYLYGFDNNIFACIELAEGKRRWKKGRYGNGQVLLLPDADQLLVLSETGETVLLRATPEGHQELARLQMLEGKTWNHPVLVNERLYVRNGEEFACYELKLRDR